jgi:catechol 1,2-dioxygenase
MKRRTFIKKSSMIAMSVSALGTIHWNGRRYVGNSPTTTDILGPFYRPGAPMRSNIIPPNSKGSPLNLSGVIFKEGGKAPVNDALVEIWQCDENEYYDNTSDEYLFRGAIKTGKNGKYEFKTIVPVPYKADPNSEASWRPAHIHMRVSVPGQQDLVTQIYFKGDKYLDKDAWSSSSLAVNRILDITKNPSGGNAVTFDVVLNKEFPLDQEVYRKITGLYNMDDKSVLEFTKSDDLLCMKWNGQMTEFLLYKGNNTFQGGSDSGFIVKFELLAKGGCKATLTEGKVSHSGERYLKYSN